MRNCGVTGVLVVEKRVNCVIVRNLLVRKRRRREVDRLNKLIQFGGVLNGLTEQLDAIFNHQLFKEVRALTTFWRATLFVGPDSVMEVCVASNKRQSEFEGMWSV